LGSKLSRKKLIISVVVIACIVAAASAAWSVWAYIDFQKAEALKEKIALEEEKIALEEEKYATTNFGDKEFNYVKSTDKEIIVPGQLLIYDIFYRNTGKIEVKDFKIEIDIPENVVVCEEYLEDYRYEFEGDSIVYEIGDLDISDGGSMNLVFKVDYPLDNGTEIISPEIKFKYFKENKLIDKSDYFTMDISEDKMFVVESSPDFNCSGLFIEGFEMGYIGEVKYDDELLYKVYVRNCGNMNACDIEVVVSDLENLVILKEESDDFNISDGEISLKIDKLDIGDVNTYYFYAQVSPDAENNSTISPHMQVKSNGNVTIKEAPECLVKLLPSFENSTLKLVDRNGGGVYSGDIIDVNITIKNTGDIDAGNMIVNLVLSNLFTLSEGNTSWEIEYLGVGEVREFSSSLRIVDGITKDSYASCNLSMASDEIESYVSSSYSVLVSGSKPFTRNYIPILEFHGIVPYPECRYENSTGAFEYLLSTLKNLGYQTITFIDLLNYMDYGKTLPEKPIIITSDDGYQSLYTYAFPILKKYGYKMTVFLITSYMGGSEDTRRMNEFDFNIAGVPHRPMLIWPEISQMSSYGCEFQSHTWSHGIIRNMYIEDSLKELVQSKSDIEVHTGKPVVFVAWPHGATSDKVLGLLPQAGYRGAVNAGGGVEDVRSLSLYAIKRLPMLREIPPEAYIEYIGLQ